MKRTLAIVSAGALFLWTGLGLFAWSRVASRLTVTPSDQERVEAEAPRLLALADEVGALHQDVRALARALGKNLQALNDDLLASQAEHAAVMELRVDALRDEVAALAPRASPDEVAELLRELGTLRDALRTSAAPGSAAQPAPSSPALAAKTGEPAGVLPHDGVPAAAPASVSEATRPRRSFLAFQLPSDDFRFDERRTWAVLPALSRVGFDAKTTLHDFTATTSAIEGVLEADLSRSGETPHAHLVVQAGTLASGDDGRDEAMREHLAVEEHSTLEFELTRFEPDEVDAAAMRATGLVHGRMSVRGVTQEVAMPVKLWIDDAHRLCVEGEMALDLRDYEVPVPNKLGLITMEKVVKVWISLRLRANPRSEG